MAKPLQLLAPPGYGPVVPLDTQTHGGMGLRAEHRYDWCRTLNAVHLNAVEFSRAALDFPIAFMRDERNGEFLPIAVLGLKEKQNLFVQDDGQWRAMTYIPAYFRRFPFCIAEVPMPNGHAAKQMICVQQDHLTANDRPLFSTDGKPTEAWPPILKLLEAIEGARQQTRVLMKRLEALALLTPFDAIAVPRKGPQMRLKGMFRVDEEKLHDIHSRDLRAMLKKGELRAIHAHLISLENFSRLMELTGTQDS